MLTKLPYEKKWLTKILSQINMKQFEMWNDPTENMLGVILKLKIY